MKENDFVKEFIDFNNMQNPLNHPNISERGLRHFMFNIATTRLSSTQLIKFSEMLNKYIMVNDVRKGNIK
jgi:hypothetical protein